jgi:ATP-dependent DNA helicase PIF1
LAYAIIGHKSQGTTISSKVIIDIKKTFAPGLTYVMLSRVTNIFLKKIIRNFTPNAFIDCTFEND